MQTESNILRMSNISKEFPGVKALQNVDFTLQKGEIHAIVGENGAGKSTLMKILSGLYPAGTYHGQIFLQEKLQEFKGIKDSEKAGIAIIYQELALVPTLSIAENMFLGREKQNRFGIINWEQTNREAVTNLKIVGLDISPLKIAGSLGIGAQQLIEIAKALAKNSSILILDEPTAALTEVESVHLLSLLRKLKAQGLSCVYISHRLHEVMDIADRITILRDGKTIATNQRKLLNEDQMVKMMVGRDLTERYPPQAAKIGDVLFSVKNWTVKRKDNGLTVCHDINLTVHCGEILGVSGLMGAGRTELVQSFVGLFGKVVSGQMLLNNRQICVDNPNKASSLGIALVSEDRKKSGLVLSMNIKENTTLAALSRLSRFGLLNDNKQILAANSMVEKVKIKTPSLEQMAGHLSGGNQQKVCIGKWLLTMPQLLILDEPTRGIDVGAKYEIYTIMRQLTADGVGIIMVSSDLAEILGMSDRILVLNQGNVGGEIAGRDATQDQIMKFATRNIENSRHF